MFHQFDGLAMNAARYFRHAQGSAGDERERGDDSIETRLGVIVEGTEANFHETSKEIRKGFSVGDVNSGASWTGAALFLSEFVVIFRVVDQPFGPHEF